MPRPNPISKQTQSIITYINSFTSCRLKEKKARKQETEKAIMEWLHYKRRGPEWKHGWTGQMLNNISTPPLPLLAIFAIVILLLSLSNYASSKAILYESANNLQLFLFLLPILFIFMMVSSTNGRLSFQDGPNHRGGSFPWGVAALVVVLLVLVSYQFAFQSKWFGALRNTV